MIQNAECSSTGLSIHHQDGTVEHIKRKKDWRDDVMWLNPQWSESGFGVTIERHGGQDQPYENH